MPLRQWPVPMQPAARSVRARAEIGLQNLVYNIRPLVTLERLAAA